MRRRLVILVLLFLIAGAVVQTGVAWVVCWRSDPFDIPYRPVRSASWPGTPLQGWEEVGSLKVDESRVPGFRMRYAYGKIESPSQGASSPIVMWNARYGLPFHGLQVTHLRSGGTWLDPRGRDLRGGLRIPQWFPQMGHWPYRFPIRPVWPGFALNTIVYAAALSGLWCLPIALRRRRRRRAGHCLRCGYDLAGLASDSPCPECAAPR